jgi:hypothetical protein
MSDTDIVFSSDFFEKNQDLLNEFERKFKINRPGPIQEAETSKEWNSDMKTLLCSSIHLGKPGPRLFKSSPKHSRTGNVSASRYYRLSCVTCLLVVCVSWYFLKY